MTHRHGVGGGGLAARAARLFLGAAGAALLLPLDAAAQFTEPPRPAAYALQNVTVVQADGTQQAGQTVVIRGGRIQSIGRLPSVPADAELLSGDSLYVYPGLIDGAGAVKFEFPRDTTSRERISSWDAPRSVQGFMPGRRVVDHLAPGASDVADLRKKGVVAVAVHPPLTDPLMPGRGAFLLLRRDGVLPQALVVDPALPPLLTLRGGRGVYPATGMAVLQWYRQLFMDAQRHAQLVQLASANPRAAVPPAHDLDMAVVQEMLRNQRVFFAANDAEEIRRVLRLAEEFRLQPVIVGGAEAWRVAADLRARDVPVLVNVDFPTPRRWKPDADTASGAAPAPAAQRERRQLEEQYANAAQLARAGVTFALVSGGRGDLRAGVRKAIEHGLPEAAALRAVTLTPATLYGAPHLGRVEAGLPATLVVTDAPVFAKDARVLYTFVDGVLERGAEARRGNGAAPAGTTGEGVRVAGRWSGEVTAGETQPFTMRLTQEGSAVTGTAESPSGTMQLTGRIDGNRITLNTTLNMGGQSVPLTFRGTIDGESMSGDIESPLGTLPWSARRTAPEGR